MYYSPKVLAFLLLGTLTRTANGLCGKDLVIEVTQGATIYTMNTVDTGEDVEDFYGYTTFHPNYDGSVPSSSGRSMMFIHRDTSATGCPLSFVAVHEHNNNDILGQVGLSFSAGDIRDDIKVLDDSDAIIQVSGNGKRTSILWKFEENQSKGFAFDLDEEFECFTVSLRRMFAIDIYAWVSPMTIGGADFGFYDLDDTVKGQAIKICQGEREDPVNGGLTLKCTVLEE
jgi:hypothetical protein